MPLKNIPQKCALIVVANGFDEMEVVSILSTLRRAGLCVKSVGLTGGSVNSVHGVSLMPDLTLAELDSWTKTNLIHVVILPGGEKSLSRLETDPRIHRLLRQVTAQQGQVAATFEGERILRATGVWRNNEEEKELNGQLLLGQPGQSPQAFAQDVARWLELPGRIVRKRQENC